ncbi:MAG: redoxin family protein [Taibaiella sp.]|nr:redoxin family protein [Taibaiella sp.]
MKKFVTTMAMFALCGNLLAQNNITSIEIGSEIPMADLKMRSVEKNDVSLADLKTNNGLLVIFSCNTCPYVIKAQERTKEVLAYAAEKGIGAIVVNSNEAQRDDEDSYKAMVKYAKNQGYKVPYAVDEASKLADAFGATRTPEVFLFDGNGMLMYKGAMEDNPGNPSESKQFYLKNAIDRVLIGMTPDPASTKSIGCGIKRIL